MRQNLFNVTMTKIMVCLGLVLAMMLVGPMGVSQAQAKEIPVSCDFEEAVKSFRKAIEDANANPGADTIVLAENCVYNFEAAAPNTANQTALPHISRDLIIVGNGATLTRVAGPTKPFRLMATGPGTSLTLQNLTIKNGSIDNGANGGGIFAAGDLTLDSVILTDNFANGSGGGLYVEGRLTVRGGSFIRNEAGAGGGVYAKKEMILDTVAFILNTARFAGGGAKTEAQATINNSQFSLNSALQSNGGGVSVDQSVQLYNTQFSKNVAGRSGGGLYLGNAFGSGISDIVNNVWIGNSAANGQGHQMALRPSPLTPNTINVRHNSMLGAGPKTGSGLYIAHSDGVIENNIVTYENIGIQNEDSNVVARYNLFDQNTTANEVGLTGTDTIEADPLFTTTEDLRLRHGSPAIDTGLEVGIGFDMNYAARPQGNRPDRGAFEYYPEEIIFSIPCSANGVASELALQRALFFANSNPGHDTLVLNSADNQLCLFDLTLPGTAGFLNIRDGLTIDGQGQTILRRSEKAKPYRILYSEAPLTLQNLTIQNGRAENSSGGGILAQTALTLTNVSLLDNVAEEDGGGVYANGPRTVVVNTFFEGNQANRRGGAMVVKGQLDLRRSTLIDNNANDSGGGIFLTEQGGVSNLVNNVWLGNRALTQGSALYAIIDGGDAVNVFHNTILGPTPAGGNGLFLSGRSPTDRFTLTNNIITNYAVGVEHQGSSAGTMTTQANLYFGNRQNEENVTDSRDHVEAEPLFVDVAGRDVRPQAGSAAIDRGIDINVTVDRAGVLRPQGNGFELGAYEFGITPNPGPQPGDTPFSIYLPLLMR